MKKPFYNNYNKKYSRYITETVTHYSSRYGSHIIYFIVADSKYYKIGISCYPYKRCRDLENNGPLKMVVLAEWPSQSKTNEGLLHNEFSKYLIPDKNEWFYKNDKLDELINRVRNNDKPYLALSESIREKFMFDYFMPNNIIEGYTYYTTKDLEVFDGKKYKITNK